MHGLPLPAGRFGLIMADPPWSFKAWGEGGYEKSAQAHYSCLTAAQIMDLNLRLVTMPDCLLWLWATWPMLQQAMDTMDRWGFTYKTGGAWHKRTKHGKTQFGTGHRLRSACEPFLIGTLGEPKTTRSVRNLVEGMVREHSRKPDEAYLAAEQLMPNAARLDLFSREARPGWTSWGLEAHKFNGVTMIKGRKLDPGRCPKTIDMFADAT